MSINNVTITGTLARDPQLRYNTGQPPEARLDVVCVENTKNADGKWEKTKNLIPVVVRGTQAERVSGWFKEGSRVEVTGSVKGFVIPADDGYGDHIRACAILARSVSAGGK